MLSDSDKKKCLKKVENMLTSDIWYYRVDTGRWVIAYKLIGRSVCRIHPNLSTNKSWLRL
jgi:hypothetical protein